MKFRAQSVNDAKSKLMKSRTSFYTAWMLVAICILTVLAVLLLRVISLPVSVVIWTVVIVFCLRGIVNGLEKRGIKRLFGAAIAYVVMFLAVSLVLLLMFSPMFGVGDQFSSLVESLPGYVNAIFGFVNDFYDRYSAVLSSQTVSGYISSIAASLGEWATAFAKNSASGVFAVGAGAANLVIAIGFALVVAFWVLLELPHMGAECRRLAGPNHAETMTMLHLTFTRVLGGYIKGTLLQCTIIGVLSWLLFLLLGIPNAAALGVISGVMNIIPVVGPWLGGALAALVGIFVSPWVALVAFIGSGVIQHGVYNLVSPLIMRSTVDIHPILTLIGLLLASAIGGAMSGGVGGAIVGMLVAIPVVAVFKSIFVYFFEKRTGRRLIAEDGVFFKGDTLEDGAEVDPMADATSLKQSTLRTSETGRNIARQREELVQALTRQKAGRQERMKSQAKNADSKRVVMRKTDIVVVEEADLLDFERIEGEIDFDDAEVLISETHVVSTTVMEEKSDLEPKREVLAPGQLDNK